jgi:hypothetical protein
MTACLRVVGLSREEHFRNYQRRHPLTERSFLEH